MPLHRLELTDFRNFESAKIEPTASGFNLIYGLNGSGKTSLLEAIYYLSFGRSFRSSLGSRIVRHSAEKFLIFAQKQGQNGQLIPIGIERDARSDLKIRIAGNNVQSAAELADVTPVQLINSNCFSLLDGGPTVRRKYLDWGIFYLNKEFLKVWRDVNQLLRQRNAALRHRAPKAELDIWNQQLSVKAELLSQFRIEYVKALKPLLTSMIDELVSIQDLEISYHPGWDAKQKYLTILEQSLSKDRQLGYTQFGPHRADFRIKTKGISAKDILSRGQQKLFICAMILAQGGLLGSGVNKKPIYLIDDLPAELDAVSRSNLIALLSKQETQIFVTAVERNALNNCLSALPLKMFHVEHGNITVTT